MSVNRLIGQAIGRYVCQSVGQQSATEKVEQSVALCPVSRAVILGAIMSLWYCQLLRQSPCLSASVSLFR